MVARRRSSAAERVPNYRPAIVSFIDILGFRELVRRRPETDVLSIIQHVQRFITVDDEDIRLDKKANISFPQTVSFSDSVIRVRHIDLGFRIGVLFHELISLLHAQAELAALGVFIRGGVTIGDVLFQDKAVFGPAVVRAYDLESQFANSPRIVVDPDALAQLRTDLRLVAEHHEPADEIHYMRKILRRGEDGLWFIDYLRAFEGEMDYPEEFPDFLQTHRNFIVTYANADGINFRARHKYLWLANYHNIVCQEYFRDIPENMLITSTDIAEFDTLPEISSHVRD